MATNRMTMEYTRRAPLMPLALPTDVKLSYVDAFGGELETPVVCEWLKLSELTSV